MQTLGLIEPLMLIVAGFSRHEGLLERCRTMLEEHFGPIVLTGPTIAFRNTAYYESSMGTNLVKRYWAFEQLQPPDQLAAVKRKTITMEQEELQEKQYPEARPLNLDPGFLGLGKFVLATTKDQAHRIYLHGGIFAEVTLRYHDGEFEPRPWTYPDWQLPQVLEFLKQARKLFCERRMSQRLQDLPPLLLPSESTVLQ
ncbi:MAG TPA: DUF4416 family protein [Gemmatales bacterium]|nr:DUF4416 family protein [Gemmatales bacterium]